jgi:CheY-like chemotaxis protein
VGEVKVRQITRLVVNRFLSFCCGQVDDNLINRKVAGSMVARYGATVECVNSGEEAIEAVKNKATNLQFDLILMDIQMPEVLQRRDPL